MNCEECGFQITTIENYGTNAHPICGVCYDALHPESNDEHSDADAGL